MRTVGEDDCAEVPGNQESSDGNGDTRDSGKHLARDLETFGRLRGIITLSNLQQAHLISRLKSCQFCFNHLIGGDMYKDILYRTISYYRWIALTKEYLT